MKRMAFFFEQRKKRIFFQFQSDQFLCIYSTVFLYQSIYDACHYVMMGTDM